MSPTRAEGPSQDVVWGGHWQGQGTLGARGTLWADAARGGTLGVGAEQRTLLGRCCQLCPGPSLQWFMSRQIPGCCSLPGDGQWRGGTERPAGVSLQPQSLLPRAARTSVLGSVLIPHLSQWPEGPCKGHPDPAPASLQASRLKRPPPRSPQQAGALCAMPTLSPGSGAVSGNSPHPTWHFPPGRVMLVDGMWPITQGPPSQAAVGSRKCRQSHAAGPTRASTRSPPTLCPPGCAFQQQRVQLGALSSDKEGAQGGLSGAAVNHVPGCCP